MPYTVSPGCLRQKLAPPPEPAPRSPCRAGENASNYNGLIAGGALDDEAWVRRAQQGDEQAFATLVERHQRAAIRLAATIAGSALAVDAAQEGFLRAHRALARFDPDRPFRPWLFRIVANAAKNEVRSSARHLRLVGRAASVRIELTVDHDPLERDEARASLIAALNRLSVDDRTVIALRWFEELSEADMAVALGVRPGTVKSRLSRAMGRLRAELSNEESGDD